MAIGSLSHITWIVKDLDQTETLITTVLDGKKIYDSGAETFSYSEERFFDVAGIWVAIMRGPALTERSYNHIAFKVESGDLPVKRRQIRDLGLDIKEDRSRMEGEGQSLYFYDFDNHLIELHTGTLKQRLQRYSLSSTSKI